MIEEQNPESQQPPIPTDSTTRVLKLTGFDNELGGIPDNLVVYRALHPEERQFGYEDRDCLRFD